MFFPKEYFEDEVRDGFFVNSIMKKCWAAQLEVLQDIDRVCKRYDINWHADCGTLLGAVRHGGFVPWDDDLDICMFRDDYLKFLKVGLRELNYMWDGYSILNYHDEQFWQPISRVVNSKSMGFDDARLNKFHGYPFAVGVDIFPLDFVCRDSEEEESRKEMLKLIYGVADSGFAEEIDDAQLNELGEALGIPFDRSRSIKLQLFELGEMISSLYTREEADEVVLMNYWYRFNDHKYSMRLFEKTIKLPFETTEIQVPAGYDKILKGLYGDYMRLVKNAGLHGYPYYEAQIDEINERMGNESPFQKNLSIDNILRDDRRQTVIQSGISAEQNITFVKTLDNTDGKITDRKEVLILPFSARHWNALDSAWRKENEDSETDVYVIPIPYYEKQPLGEVGQQINMDDRYPEYVPITKFEDYSFEDHRPDKIIIQYPFDNDNFATTIAADFYTENLRKLTDELVYIPYFLTDEIGPGEERAYKMMDYYVLSPAVIYADRVIVQSENIKELYVKKLTEYFGEDTRKMWEKKIEGTGTSIYENHNKLSKHDIDMPDEWRNIIFREDGSAKKVIIYYTSISGLFEYKDRMIDKIRSSMNIFKENSYDVALIWHPDPLIEATIPSTDSELYDKFTKVVSDYKGEGFGIYDDSKCADTALELSDAYYGDADKLVQKFRNRGLPVMIQNVEIC